MRGLAPLTARRLDPTMTAMARILLVDDDHRILEMLADFLGGLGYDMLTAGNGEEALAVSSGREIDLIISDFHMPGLTATELLDRLRANYPARTVPAIIMSGSSPDEAPQIARKPRVHYLVKPVDLAHLRACIEQMLEPLR